MQHRFLQSSILSLFFTAAAYGYDHNPEGPEIPVILPGQTQVVEIDADLLAHNGKMTVAFLAQMDTDLQNFVHVPSAADMKKSDPALFEKSKMFYPFLDQRLRTIFSAAGFKKQDSDLLLHAFSVLCARGTLDATKIVETITLDSRTHDHHLLNTLLVIAKNPRSTKTQDILWITQHIEGHYAGKETLIPQLHSAFDKIQNTCREILNTPSL